MVDIYLFVGLLGVVLAIIGIILTIFSSKRLSQKKIPRFCFNNDEIIAKRSKHKDIKYFYKDKEIDRVTVTNIWIWNSGRLPIIEKDLQPDSQLIIEIIDEKHTDISILEFNLITGLLQFLTRSPCISFFIGS